MHLADREIPRIGDREVLIKVCAAGVNRPDVIQRRGNYPAPKGIVQDIPGLEVSGRIEAAGSAVRGWKTGQEVCALVPGGGYAGYVAADAGSCLPVPRHISLEEAAALPETLFTVWHNVFQRGQLQQHEELLVYGGSGGIGSMAIQLASLYGAGVTAVAGTDKKKDYCLSLGAARAINYKAGDLTDALKSESFDLILDSVGGDYLDINLELLKAEGRLVYINAMEGGKPRLNIFRVMQKRLYITGSTLRSRSYDFKRELAADILERAFPLLENKGFDPVVKHRFPAAEAAKAHALMESRDFTGKIILYF